jgi:DNA processing protein
MRSDDAYWLLFAHLGLPPNQATELLSVFGGPGAVFAASRQELANVSPGGARLHHRVREAERSTDLAEVCRLLERVEATVLAIDDAAYPPLLRTIHAPPPVLFVQGDAGALSAPAVCIVGSRRGSAYGMSVAHQLAADLVGAGLVVVSGLAVGIDSAAHGGALDGGGRTVGVLGCSLEVDYPRGSRDLKRRIVEAGALVSEFPPGTTPRPYTFPQRNRVVSGLSLGAIAVEAPEASGALITAQHALEQGREVMAVPGDITSGRNRGCHALLRDGATLVEAAEHVLAALDLPPRDVPQPPGPARPRADGLSPPEQSVLGVLGVDPSSVEALMGLTGLSPADINSCLMLLEMKGHARRLPGGRYVAA